MPCMDNDVLRRGKPTVHVQYDEATRAAGRRRAAGAGLRGAARRATASPTTARAGRACCSLLARGRRLAGMAAARRSTWPASAWRSTLRAAARHAPPQDRRAAARRVLLGAACGKALERGRTGQRWTSTRKAIGLAFQVVDDILDVDAPTRRRSARPPARTAADNKPTYVIVLGLDAAHAQLAERAARSARACGARARSGWPKHATSACCARSSSAITDRAARHGINDAYDCSKTINDPADLRELDRAPARSSSPTSCAHFVLESVSQTGGHLSSQPRHGRADHRAALRVRHAGRPHRVGRRPPDLSAQDPHRPARAHGHAAPARRHLGLPAPRRERVRHLRHRALVAPRSPPRSAWRSAAKLKGENRRAVAVIGDGAMTAGMAFEALNNAGVDATSNLLVILNDNDMSISPPVGALNRYLARLMSRPASTPPRETAARRVLQARRRCCELAQARSRSTPRAWSCPARCSRSSASTTSARSTATTSTR